MAKNVPVQSMQVKTDAECALDGALAGLISGKLTLPERDPYITLAAEMRTAPHHLFEASMRITQCIKTCFERYEVEALHQPAALRKIAELVRMGLDGADITNLEVRNKLREFSKAAGLSHSVATDLLGDLLGMVRSEAADFINKAEQVQRKLLDTAPIKSKKDATVVQLTDEEKIKIRQDLLNILFDKTALERYKANYKREHPMPARRIDAMEAWLTIFAQNALEDRCGSTIEAVKPAVKTLQTIARMVVHEGKGLKEDGQFSEEAKKILETAARQHNLPKQGLQSATYDFLAALGMS